MRRLKMRSILPLLCAAALPLVPAEIVYAQDGTGTGGSGARIEQGVSVGVDSAPAGGLPDPRECTRCYEVFEKQTRECRTMENEVDRNVCLDAVRDAYQRCSKSC
ncbi:MAG: hypothetical protein R3286_16065 [Gammaproteobacteria bacterium]|nr:hypothetical protein [Gammaproteobacteria bacterium]